MSFVWGWLCDRLGPEADAGRGARCRGRSGCVIGGVALGFGPAGLAPFLVAGAILGSGLGGVQVADRVLMVRLSPPDRLGEFFGLYGLVGKGSQVIGQLLYGATIFLLLDRSAIGAYQVAVLQPARDDAHRALADLAGPRRLGRQRWAPARSRCAPPERLAPATAPIEPRGAQSRVAAPGGAWRHAQAEPTISSRVGRAARQPRTSAPARSARRAPADRRRGAARSRTGSPARRRASAAAITSRIAEPAAVAEVADERLVASGGRRARSPRAPAGARRPGRRRGCSRGCTCRPASGSRRRRRSAAGRAVGRPEDVRDEVGLGVVVLAERVGRAGDVEVAQGHAAQPVRGRTRPARPRTRASSRRTG